MAKRRSAARGRTRRRRSRRRRAAGFGAGGALAVVLAVVFLLPLGAEALARLARSSWAPAAVAAAVLGAPAGAAVWAARRGRARYRREVLRRARIDALTPRGFEDLAAELLRRDGFRGVRTVGGAGDRGVDVVGTAPDGTRYAVQCKHYSRPVGPGAVRDFIGALHARPYRGHQGVLLTSNHLTESALETAREQRLIVIDRDRLADWLRDAYRLGPPTARTTRTTRTIRTTRSTRPP
ncbi:restriction endonuclease [Bailinhaonella thermotolerans]|uniref:Restriction endonuclease n=1 Tax=Bailinhaonella thermotolerans TaxID=1070861 RepID=A0A3A4BDW9_9ACTN|nr:restriction endonuclease [Bailinhaonella thermotolerans]RJL32490.1 restriction endonuclease [Bailinhaonella thermotolerans]